MQTALPELPLPKVWDNGSDFSQFPLTQNPRTAHDLLNCIASSSITNYFQTFQNIRLTTLLNFYVSNDRKQPSPDAQSHTFERPSLDENGMLSFPGFPPKGYTNHPMHFHFSVRAREQREYEALDRFATHFLYHMVMHNPEVTGKKYEELHRNGKILDLAVCMQGDPVTIMEVNPEGVTVWHRPVERIEIFSKFEAWSLAYQGLGG